jgi:hypothetical protein
MGWHKILAHVYLRIYIYVGDTMIFCVLLQSQYLMMNRLFAFALLCTFSACSPRVFLPERANVPMLREAGEVKLTSSIKIQNQSAAPGNGWSPSLDLSGSPIQNMGLLFSYRSTDKYAIEDDWFSSRDFRDSVHYAGKRLEFGAGYYNNFGKRGHIEIYGGGAFGKFQRDDLKGRQGEFETRYYRIYLQPALGFYVRDAFELSGGARFTYQRFTDFLSPDAGLRYQFTTPAADISRVPLYFVEPFVNISAGYKYVKFNIQPGFSNNISRPRIDNNLSFYMSMGITFQIAPRFFK